MTPRTFYDRKLRPIILLQAYLDRWKDPESTDFEYLFNCFNTKSVIENRIKYGFRVRKESRVWIKKGRVEENILTIRAEELLDSA